MLRQLFEIPVDDYTLQRRGRIVISIALMIMGLLCIAIIPALFLPNLHASIIGLGVGFFFTIATIALTRSGRVSLASWFLLGFLLIDTALVTLFEPDRPATLFFFVVPLIVCSLTLPSRMVWLVLGISLAVVAIKAGQMGANLETLVYERNVLLYGGVAISMVAIISYLGALLVEQSFAELSRTLQALAASNRQVAELNMNLEAQVQKRTADLQQALVDLQVHIAEKNNLLNENAYQRDTIREMSSPVLPVGPNTLVMPLVGDLDDHRLQDTQQQALSAIERTGARRLLLDITGVPIVDTFVAQGLIRIIQSARLLGAWPVLIGVRPEVAQSLVALGIDLTEIRTANNLEMALRKFST